MLPTISLAHSYIRHRRYTPRSHAFTYEMGYVFVDIDALSVVCQRSLCWSHNRFNWVSIYDQDLIDDPKIPLRQRIQRVIAEQLKGVVSEQDKIYVLTLPRYLGMAFNPVSFFWVYEGSSLNAKACDIDTASIAARPKYIVAHITNTPWHEHCVYCFECQVPVGDTVEGVADSKLSRFPTYRFVFDKRFHVSPFMPMQLKYDWRFKLDLTTDPSHSVIHMQLKQHQQLIFDATMQFQLKAFSKWRQALFPVIYPLQSIKVVLAIYWQALRLYLKKVPFYTHPSTH